tara:strand:+ start:359 stop:913 length:555 start_codon:yes stop_codon:yes gene_type:complete
VNSINLAEKLITKKIYLKKFDKSFERDFLEYSINKDLYKYFEYEIKKIRDAKNYFKIIINKQKKGKVFFYGIILKETNKCVGSISIKNYDHVRKSLEIGYAINPNFQRRNLFYTSAKTLIEYLFKKKKIKRIYATTSVDNIGSIKSLKKLKFKKEGRLISYYMIRKQKNYYSDAFIYSFINNEI